MTDILIADDQLIVRKGLTCLLSNEIDINVTGEANHSKKMFELLQSQTFDLVVITMSLATQDGYTPLDRLIKQYPNLPVLLLNVCLEHYSVLQTLELRVSGYLDKEAHPENLIQAIRKIPKKETYISETLAKKVALKQTEKNTALSKREHQILCMIASGKIPKDIAEILCISIKTISTYKSRILQKLNLNCDAGLIRYAIENNLIET